MLRRNGQRLCKFAAFLVALAVVFYTFGKCDDFVPALFKKLDEFADQLNKLLPQLNTMTKPRLNYTAVGLRSSRQDGHWTNGSLKGNGEKTLNNVNERDIRVKVQKPSEGNPQSKRELQDAENHFSRQSDFFKLFTKFTERLNFEADRRQSQFENILKNVTRILEDYHQKRHEDSLGIDAHKNQSKRSEKSAALAGNKPQYIGENPELLKRRPFTSHAAAKPSETTPKDYLTFGNEKEIGDRIGSIPVNDFATKTAVISKENQQSNISEISSLKNYLSEKMPRKELSIGNSNQGILITIKPTATQKHKNPAQSIRIPEPNNAVVKSAEIMHRTGLFQPNSTSALKVNYPSSKTENLVQLREKSITSRPSYNAFTSRPNLAWTKTNSKMQITRTIKILPTLKPTKHLMDQNTLNRRAEVFLRKMKNFGVTYNERVFYYKDQPNSGIFYREVLPVASVGNKLTIFLLHDSHYDSKTWLGIGTLYYLATHGYRVIALDLPGRGKSKNVSEPPTSIEKLKFLVSFMLAVTPKSPRVAVSPGESGLYSVPMVMSASVMLEGVVFISTAHTGKYPSSRYENVHLPALVIYGENDNTAFLGEFLGSMNHLPNSRRFHSIQKAGHNCYLEQPDDFHELLTDFLPRITQRGKTWKNIRARKGRLGK